MAASPAPDFIDGISTDFAYDGGSARRQARALKPLERDILCRILFDIKNAVRRGEQAQLERVIRGFTQEEFNALMGMIRVLTPRPEDA